MKNLMTGIKTVTLASAALAGILTAGGGAGGSGGGALLPPPSAASRSETPLPYFIRNDGQLDPEARYYFKGARGTVYLTRNEVVFDFLQSRPAEPGEAAPTGVAGPEEGTDPAVFSRLVFRLRFLNPGPETVLEGRKELPGKINYFIGDPADWRTAIPTFEEVVFRHLYPGIDLACRFAGGGLAYHFTAAPGSDPGRIAFRHPGTQGVEINPGGDLIVLTPLGGFRTPAPRIRQEIAGEEIPRRGAFIIREDSSVALELGPYDPETPLFIDF